MLFIEPGEPAELALRANSLLRASFGSEAELVARAPGRVNLIGEHTDYNDGLCLPLPLGHATYAAAVRRTDSRVRAISTLAPDGFDGEPEDATGWAAYAAGVVWALREEGVDAPGVDLAITSTVPPGAGLASSAALGCAVARAVTALVGGVSPDVLVRAAMRAERDLAGAPTGGMDQTLAIYGHSGEALLLDFADGSRTHVPWAPPGLTLLVIDTQVRHALVDGQYADRRASCRTAAGALHARTLREVSEDDLAGVSGDPAWLPRARHVVTENLRVEEFVRAVAGGEWAEAGALLTSSHESLRDDYEVSCPQLDTAVKAAGQAGALGARMTGGGFGGSAIALVPEHRMTRVVASVELAFRARGWTSPRFLLA
jgi:galactokinase